MKTNHLFMAIAKGNVSTEGAEIKRFIGIASCKVLAVNPDKKKLSELYGRDIEDEPTYISEVEVGDDKHKVESVRFDFIVKADEKSGVDFTTKVSYFLRNEIRYNKDQSKVQVIDKYGRTAWVNVEQVKAHEIPMYSNGPANIDKDYRPCFVGEEELTEFIKNFLNIPSVMKYNRDNKSWSLVDKPEECEVRLDNIKNYFEGDYKEITEAISWQPDNKIKIMFGIKNTDDNKQYQTAYTKMTLKNGVTNYDKLGAHLKATQDAGALVSSEFSLEPIHEYVVEATNFNNSKNSDMPFGDDAPTDAPW